MIIGKLIGLSVGLGKLVSWILLVIYLVLPVFIYTYPQIVSRFVFLYNMYCPLDVYYKDFAYYGFNPLLSRDFHLTRVTDAGEHVSLGAWHLVPHSLLPLFSSIDDNGSHVESDQHSLFQSAFQTDTRVLLYVHGASGTRANAHRIELYQVALASDLQVFTFDYRGYADSSGLTRTEHDAVDDAFAAYQWLQAARSRGGIDKNGNERLGLVLWAHSLGTGITLRLLADMMDTIADDEYLKHFLPETVVLESPFHDLIEASYYYPISLPYRQTPLFETVFIRAMNVSNIRFASASNAARVCRRLPMLQFLILHAADDLILPIELGRHLYDAMLQAGCRNVRFIEFPADLGYGHRHIHRAPEVQHILRNEV